MLVSQAQAGNSLREVDRARPAIASVRVTVPARLHLGFVDLHGGLGRRFGSLGLALEAPVTRLCLRRGALAAAEGPCAARALAYLTTLRAHFGGERDLQLLIESAIPEHVGLGSGTQLSLAIAVAFCRLHGLEEETWTLARMLERGLRSSIGIATFERGGLVLDGGRGEADLPPPVLSRLPFPDAWRVILILDHERRGLHGRAEIEAFDALPPFPAERAAHLCRLVLMSLLPALAERDLDRFGAALAELQRAVGDYFAPAQGARFTSPRVAEALAWMEAAGIRGIGQSSWGPTGFAIVGSEQDAARIVHGAQQRWPARSGLSFAVTRGRNRGGDVTVTPVIAP